MIKVKNKSRAGRIKIRAMPICRSFLVESVTDIPDPEI
jgi:hypothetical protein